MYIIKENKISKELVVNLLVCVFVDCMRGDSGAAKAISNRAS